MDPHPRQVISAPSRRVARGRVRGAFVALGLLAGGALAGWLLARSAGDDAAASSAGARPRGASACVLGLAPIDLSLEKVGGRVPGPVRLRLAMRSGVDADGVEVQAVPGRGVTLLGARAGSPLWRGSVRRHERAAIDLDVHVPDTAYRQVRLDVLVTQGTGRLVGRVTWSSGRPAAAASLRAPPVIVDDRGQRTMLLPAVERVR